MPTPHSHSRSCFTNPSQISVLHTFILVVISLFAFSALSANPNQLQPGAFCASSLGGINPNTHEYSDPCHNDVLYCNDNNTCTYRGCRRDQFPFGYGNVPEPPLCGAGSFCPDRMNSCMPLIPIGGACEFARDDECQLPAKGANQSVCLNLICYAQNVTAGQACTIENTTYYDVTTGASTLLTRDSCVSPGLYCDDITQICIAQKSLGVTCAEDRECITNTCDDKSHQCANAPETPRAFPVWVYVVVGLAIIIVIVLICVALFFIHQRTRKRRQAKVDQYFQEQIAFRNSIISMHSAARSSMYSLPTASPQESKSNIALNTVPAHDQPEGYGRVPTNVAMNKQSGLRNVQKPEDQ